MAFDRSLFFFFFFHFYSFQEEKERKKRIQLTGLTLQSKPNCQYCGFIGSCIPRYVGRYLTCLRNVRIDGVGPREAPPSMM